MATAKTGRGSGIGAGNEGTHGTAAARAVWRPVVSAGLQTQLEQAPRPDLFKSGGSPISGGHHEVRTTSGGSVSLLATYNSIGLFLQAALGAAGVLGSGPYVHTSTLAQDILSLTLDLLRGTPA